MLTRFGTVSRRGFWRDIILAPAIDDGTLTDFLAATLEIRAWPTDRVDWRDDYGWRRRCDATPALFATTSGLGDGEFKILEPRAAQFYFPASVMQGQCSGIHEISVLAIVGPETSEILRDQVVFF